MQAVKKKEQYRKNCVEIVKYVGIDGMLYTVNTGEIVPCLPQIQETRYGLYPRTTEEKSGQ